MSLYPRIVVALLFFGGGATLLFRHWEDQLTSIGIERCYFAEKIDDHENDYLAAMRDTLLGPKTILYRNPDIIFFGDSHTYSSWDFHALQKELPLKMGCYSISGAYLENVCDMLNAVKANGLSTRYLVLGLSPRMLWEAPDKQQYIKQVRNELASVGSPKENFVTLANGQWRKVDRFLNAEMKVRNSLPPLEAGLKKIDPEQLSRFLTEHGPEFKMTNYWLKFVDEGRPFPQLNAVIEQIGRKAQACGVQLGVVYIPESRWLTGLYTEAQRAHFLVAVRELEKIASFTNIEWYVRGGGDDRYFVNRFMIADYPYDIWKDPQRAKKWIEADKSQREWQLFDADHMNLAGAEHFTRSVTPALRGWIRQAEQTPPALRR